MSYKRHVPSQSVTAEGLAEIFDASADATAMKLGNLALWTCRQDLTRMLFRYELFKEVLNVHGSIVECGVGHGGGIVAWHHFSAILEPVNHQRTIVGFDTFEGFPELHDADAGSTSEHAHPGGLAVDSADQILRCVGLHNLNRPLGHMENKLQLVKGDARETIPAYLAANTQFLVSLLYLDFDLYEPTRVALENFLPRMPKGAVVAFDELNIPDWPGETIAALPLMRGLELRRTPWGPTTTYATV